MLTWTPDENESRRTLEQRIREAIEVPLPALQRAAVQRESISPFSDDDLHVTSLSSRLGKHVKSALTIQDGLFIRTDSGGQSFGLLEIATGLVSKARLTSPKEAIEWVDRLSAMPSASGLTVVPLWGLPPISQKVDLGHGLFLCPFGAVPDSRGKKLFERMHLARPGYFTEIPCGPPGAALCASRTIEPLFSAASTTYDAAKLELYSRAFLIRDLLTLVGPCCPMQQEGWFQFDDPDVELALAMSVSFSGPHNEIWPVVLRFDGVFDSAQARAVVDAYFAASAKVRDRAAMAAGRLNLAMRRMHQGDKALDICMALESVLSKDSRDNSFTLALRAALLLESTVNARHDVRSTVKTVYKMRNDVAHGGMGAVPDGARERELVEEGAMTCARTIRRVLEVGHDIDWYRVELGATP